MNSWFLGGMAGLLAAIGVVHSILAERRIFAPRRHAARGGLPPSHHPIAARRVVQ